MDNIKPTPKSQRELSESVRTPYVNPETDSEFAGAVSTSSGVNRAEQKSVKEDNTKLFDVGIEDIDTAIFYYFQNVIKPSVVKNGVKVNVPVIYAGKEKWAAVQKDGFYRDKNGKIMAPLIVLKRDSIRKNRKLGNKLDANQPHNYGIFEKKYSKHNVYDRMGLLTNRKPTKEYYAVIMPDYVDITYSGIILTDYISQMNKIIEAVNYASDSYWGDPLKFSFRAMIDEFGTTTELISGKDRSSKTTFQISILGHLIPDSINASMKNVKKLYSNSSVRFTSETVRDINSL